MVSVEVARTPSRATPIEPDDAAPPASPFAVVWILLLWQTSALTLQVFAVCMARQDAHGNANGGLGCCPAVVLRSRSRVRCGSSRVHGWRELCGTPRWCVSG